MSCTVRKIDEEKYLTQKELAKRWKVSEGTIKNRRDNKIIKEFLRMPGSTKVLYPLNHINEVEKQYTTKVKEVDKREKKTELKRNKPVVSAKPEKKWRV